MFLQWCIFCFSQEKLSIVQIKICLEWERKQALGILGSKLPLIQITSGHKQRGIQIFYRGGSRYFAEGDPDIWGLKLNFQALLKKKNTRIFYKLKMGHAHEVPRSLSLLASWSICLGAEVTPGKSIWGNISLKATVLCSVVPFSVVQLPAEGGLSSTSGT